MSSQNPVEERWIDEKYMVALCESFLVSKTNMNQYLKLEKYLSSIFVCFGNMWRLYDENIWYDMIWYDMIWYIFGISKTFHTALS